MDIMCSKKGKPIYTYRTIEDILLHVWFHIHFITMASRLKSKPLSNTANNTTSNKKP